MILREGQISGGISGSCIEGIRRSRQFPAQSYGMFLFSWLQERCLLCLLAGASFGLSSFHGSLLQIRLATHNAWADLGNASLECVQRWGSMGVTVDTEIKVKLIPPTYFFAFGFFSTYFNSNNFWHDSQFKVNFIDPPPPPNVLLLSLS